MRRRERAKEGNGDGGLAETSSPRVGGENEGDLGDDGRVRSASEGTEWQQVEGGGSPEDGWRRGRMLSDRDLQPPRGRLGTMDSYFLGQDNSSDLAASGSQPSPRTPNSSAEYFGIAVQSITSAYGGDDDDKENEEDGQEDGEWEDQKQKRFLRGAAESIRTLPSPLSIVPSEDAGFEARNTVQYGDSLRLWTLSPYAEEDSQQPHVDGLGNSPEGRSKGGFIGAYRKHSRGKFLMGREMLAIVGQEGIPPKCFVEHNFEVVDPCGLHARGDLVMYGDTVLLVNSDGSVWNSKTKSRTGYLNMKARGLKGETLVRFQPKSSKCASSSPRGPMLGSASLATSSKKLGNIARTLIPSSLSGGGGGFPPAENTSPLDRKKHREGLDSPASWEQVAKMPLRYGDSGVRILVGKSGSCVPLSAYRKQSSDVTCGYICTSNKGKTLSFTLYRSFVRIQRVIVEQYSSSERKGIGSGILRRIGSGLSSSDRASERRGESQAAVYSGIEWDNHLSFFVPTRHLMNVSASDRRLLGSATDKAGVEKEANSKAIAARIVLSNGSEALLRFGAILSRCRSGLPSQISLPVQDERLEGAVEVSLAVELHDGGADGKGWWRTLSLSELPFAASGLVALLGIRTPLGSMEASSLRPESLCVSAFLASALAVFLYVASRFILTSHSRHAWMRAPLVEVKIHFIRWRDDSTEGNNDEVNSPASELGDFFSLPGTQLPPMPRRFLIAEKGDIEKARVRWQQTVLWRDENGTDGALTTPHPNFGTIKSIYHHMFHGRDKHGHIVYYEQPGKIDFSALRDGGLTRQDLVSHYVYAMEYCWKVLQPLESDKMTVVIDCKGVRFRDLAGEASQFLKTTVGILSKHYPQRSCSIFILNAPDFFNVAYGLVKPLLNKTTRDKIKLVSPSQQREVLLEVIDEGELAQEYGGSCEHPLGQSPEEKDLRVFVTSRLQKPSIPAASLTRMNTV